MILKNYYLNLSRYKSCPKNQIKRRFHHFLGFSWKQGFSWKTRNRCSLFNCWRYQEIFQKDYRQNHIIQSISIKYHMKDKAPKPSKTIYVQKAPDTIEDQTLMAETLFLESKTLQLIHELDNHHIGLEMQNQIVKTFILFQIIMILLLNLVKNFKR